MTEPRLLPLPRPGNTHELSRRTGLGCSPFARRYWENRGCCLFLRVLRWFTSPRSLHTPYVFRGGCPDMTRDGFPHSEIPGSKPACGSPRLIAACHVLHRPPAPRHPPYALSSLTTKVVILTLSIEMLVTDDQFSKSSFRSGRASDPESNFFCLVEMTRVELATSCVQGRRSPD